MSNADDHRWDLNEDDKGYTQECDDAFEEKLEEWQARGWMEWLAKELIFPFILTREEDEDDAYFSSGAAKALFRLGHQMELLALDEEDVDRGLMVKVREKGQVGYVPRADLEVNSKSDKNFWPVREYVVWFANRY